jgi:ribosomal small subunit protein bTHX
MQTRSRTQGAGDKRTRRGKIAKGSYGNTRPQGTRKPAAASAATKPSARNKAR